MATHTPKLVGRHVRTEVLPDLTPSLLLSQCGSGMNGGESAAAHLYIRNLMDLARLANISVSYVFFL